MKELYERALSFASLKHAGQLRKDGKPYITHPEKVASAFIDTGGGDLHRDII